MQGYPVVAGYLHVQLKPLGLGGHGSRCCHLAYGEDSSGSSRSTQRDPRSLWLGRSFRLEMIEDRGATLRRGP